MSAIEAREGRSEATTVDDVRELVRAHLLDAEQALGRNYDRAASLRIDALRAILETLA